MHTGLLENPGWAEHSWESPRANRGKGAGKAERVEKAGGCLSWAGGVGRKRIRESSLRLCILEEQKESGQREPPAPPQVPPAISRGLEEGAAGLSHLHR